MNGPALGSAATCYRRLENKEGDEAAKRIIFHKMAKQARHGGHRGCVTAEQQFNLSYKEEDNNVVVIAYIPPWRLWLDGAGLIPPCGGGSAQPPSAGPKGSFMIASAQASKRSALQS